jgi:S-disulfanyl-L-cysteine oxidoreductase SoxD
MRDQITRDVKLAALLLVLVSCGATLRAQEAPRTTNDGLYSEAQAERGHAAYSKYCQACHGETMAGIDQAPPLVGGHFLGNWVGQSVGDLLARVRTTMPSNAPGTLSAATCTDIVSHLLHANGYPAGSEELPHNAQILQMLRIDPQKSGT